MENTSRFSLDRFGNDGLERLKHVTPGNIASKQSTSVSGAEQERWQAHFGLKDPTKVKEAATGLLKTRGTGAEQDVHAGHFGYGYDGRQLMQKMLETEGVGAEQVWFHSADHAELTSI
jgi:hypothetical protein